MPHNFQMSQSHNVVIFFFFLFRYSCKWKVNGWRNQLPTAHSFPLASTDLFLRVYKLSEGSPPSPRISRHCGNASLMHCLKYWLLCDYEHLKIKTAWWQVVFTQIREIKLWTIQVSSNQFQLVHTQFQPQASEEKMWFWQCELLVGV